MENLAKTLQNKQILVVKSETLINGKENKSKISNKIISLGLVTKITEDLIYFEQIALGEKLYKPMYFNNKITLWAQNYRAKNIIIEEFKLL